MRFLAEVPEDLFFFRLFLCYCLFILARNYLLCTSICYVQDLLFP